MKTGFFDQKRFGLALRKARRRMGYSSPDAFCEVVESLTGVSIPRDTLQRIEAGKQDIKAAHLVAYLAAVCELPLKATGFWADALTDEMMESAIKAWKTAKRPEPKRAATPPEAKELSERDYGREYYAYDAENDTLVSYLFGVEHSITF